MIGRNSELTVMNPVYLRTSSNWSERNSTIQALVTKRNEERICSTIVVSARTELDCADQHNVQIFLDD
jgi:hypothetical protein